MKRSTIAETFTIAAVAALTLGIAPTAKADDRGCSNASLHGTFAFTSTGSIVIPPPAPGQGAPLGPEAEVGTQTFDGTGGTTGAATLVSGDGTVYQITFTGTYTVNPDCTGDFTLQIAPFNGAIHVYIVIDDNWLEFRGIQGRAGRVAGGVLTRIGRKMYPGTTI